MIGYDGTDYAEIVRLANAVLSWTTASETDKKVARAAIKMAARIGKLEDGLRFYAATDGEIALMALAGKEINWARTT